VRWSICFILMDLLDYRKKAVSFIIILCILVCVLILVLTCKLNKRKATSPTSICYLFVCFCNFLSASASLCLFLLVLSASGSHYLCLLVFFCPQLVIVFLWKILSPFVIFPPFLFLSALIFFVCFCQSLSVADCTCLPLLVFDCSYKSMSLSLSICLPLL
jgi:hypothetical protein